MGVIDYFNGGQVIVQLPSGGGADLEISNHPTTLMFNVSDVTQQEGLPTDPNPHKILTVSLWFPKLNLYLPVAIFTDDVAAQEYGKNLVRGTPIWMPDYNITNFFVYPPPLGPYKIRRLNVSSSDLVLKVSLNPASTDKINLPFKDLPSNHPYYVDRDTDLSFRLPSLTLEFRGFSDPFSEQERTTMPIGTTAKMIQRTTSRPAWVRLGIVNWIKNLHSPLKFVGILYQNGTREFTYTYPSHVFPP